jgi:hypothetical protein
MDDIKDVPLIDRQLVGRMKTNSNQKKHFGAVARNAATICLGIFLLAAAAPAAVASDLVYVSLPSGVTLIHWPIVAAWSFCRREKFHFPHP